MTTRFYNYPWNIKIAKIMGWLMFSFSIAFDCIIIMLMIGVVLKWVTPLTPIEPAPSNLLESLFIGLNLVLGFPLLCLAVIHYYPNIGINERGLQVQFMWGYITVPWVEIIAVEEGSLGVMRCMRVKARRITWLHYFYGITCPAVMIYSSIDNYGEVVREIRSHISKTRAE